MDPRHLVQLATILEKGSITKASKLLPLRLNACLAKRGCRLWTARPILSR